MSQLQNQLRFLIIVIHKNGFDRLNNFFKHLVPQIDFSKDKLIVVDNKSTDDSIAQIREAYRAFSIVYLENPYNYGYAQACNQAIALLDSQYVIICNNDLILQDKTLLTLESLFDSHPQVGMIGGELKSDQGEDSTSAGIGFPSLLTEIGLKKTRRIKTVQKNTYVHSLIGAFMAVRRRAIDEAGALNPKFFFYFEETEWCQRILSHGWQIMLTPEIKLTHTLGASTKNFRSVARIEYLRSQILYWETRFRKTQTWLLIGFLWLKLLSKCLFHASVIVLSLGLYQHAKNKFRVNAICWLWLSMGQPKNWGLPDKPPEEAA